MTTRHELSDCRIASHLLPAVYTRDSRPQTTFQRTPRVYAQAGFATSGFSNMRVPLGEQLQIFQGNTCRTYTARDFGGWENAVAHVSTVEYLCLKRHASGLHGEQCSATTRRDNFAALNGLWNLVHSVYMPEQEGNRQVHVVTNLTTRRTYLYHCFRSITEGEVVLGHVPNKDGFDPIGSIDLHLHLQHHLHGAWGDVSDRDVAVNEAATEAWRMGKGLAHENLVTSRYVIRKGGEHYITMQIVTVLTRRSSWSLVEEGRSTVISFDDEPIRTENLLAVR